MPGPWKIVDLDPEEPFRAALGKVLAGWLQQTLSYAPATLKGKDPQALHNMRVSALRLRALMRLHKENFPARALRRRLRDLRRLIRALGPVREIDVFQVELRKLAAEAPPAERVALRWLMAEQEVRRERLRGPMKDSVRRFQGEPSRRRFERLIAESLQ
ncbi:MAG: CHAD domain-containing protein [Acidobacteria bacterium]|nr:CHAD domain-containing protein [Acidobacteriota bacterium]